MRVRTGRGERIRTSDPLRPRQVRYQAALRPDCFDYSRDALSSLQRDRRTIIWLAMPDPQYALVAYIRNALGQFVDDLRCELHPEHAHLPAHVSILPPRPLEGSEADALEHLVELCQKVEPFEIELGAVETFLPTTPTVFLQISFAAYKLRELHDLLNSDGLAFEEQLPYMPHLTIAKLNTVERAREVYQLSRDQWDRYEGPRRVTIENLTFVRGRDFNWSDLAPIELAGKRSAGRLR